MCVWIFCIYTYGKVPKSMHAKVPNTVRQYTLAIAQRFNGGKFDEWLAICKVFRSILMFLLWNLQQFVKFYLSKYCVANGLMSKFYPVKLLYYTVASLNWIILYYALMAYNMLTRFNSVRRTPEFWTTYTWLYWWENCTKIKYLCIRWFITKHWPI